MALPEKSVIFTGKEMLLLVATSVAITIALNLFSWAVGFIAQCILFFAALLAGYWLRAAGVFRSGADIEIISGSRDYGSGAQKKREGRTA